MMELNVYNTSAKKVGTVAVSEQVFGCEYKEALVHQAVVAYLANQRQGNKSTLTRSEVRGGGKKPWRQKRTGRARQGSIRSPQWTGGGVVFAPKQRDFSQKLNKQMKRAAFLSALSARVADGGLTVVDKLELAEAKTKLMAAVIKNFGVAGKVLVVTDVDDEKVLRASGNIPGVTVANVDLVNVYELAANAKCLVTKAAVEKLNAKYAEEASEEVTEK